MHRQNVATDTCMASQLHDGKEYGHEEAFM